MQSPLPVCLIRTSCPRQKPQASALSAIVVTGAAGGLLSIPTGSVTRANTSASSPRQTLLTRERDYAASSGSTHQTLAPVIALSRQS